ncbi:MAG: PmoA family protein [Fimbriimonadales bacterium]|nr:PmoA family protein [Fimbriimonadales bacterium]
MQEEAEQPMRVSVHALQAEYRQTPIWAEVRQGGLLREPLALQHGTEFVPAQVARVGGRRYLVWVEPELLRGKSKIYAVRAHPRPMEGFQHTQTENALQIRYQGKPFTAYVFRGAPKPYLYPVMGPHDKPITRHFPMQRVAGETTDHPHHRSIWFTHGAVNGVDFWTEGSGKGTIVHQALEVVESGPVLARWVARNEWRTPDGKPLLEERTEVICYHTPNARWLDYTVALTAIDADVKFGDTKEGTFGVRVASSMEVTRNAGGQIVNAAGQRDREAWGKRATWCDYTGIVDGEVVGIAIFDHPMNLRHPTYWHVRDYGLFAANPFGVHDFVPDTPKGEGDYLLKKGDTLTFRYRLWLHRGRTDEAGVANQYEAYKNAPRVVWRA